MEEIMTRFIGVCAAVSVMAAASVAGAQEFAKGGQVVIAAERLTGVFSDHLTSEIPGTKETINSTRVALLGMPSAWSFQSLMAGPASTPRLAADVFVIHGLSLGGSIMYLNDSGSDKTENPPNPTTHDDLPTTSTFIFSPRIGYGLQLGQNFAIWPRAGVTYANYRITSRNTDPGPPPVTHETKSSIDFTDVTVEFMLGILPVDHFVILVGPYIDIPLGGGQRVWDDGVRQAPEPDVSYLSFGLSVGLGGFF
jgi:hypothetical protein